MKPPATKRKFGKGLLLINFVLFMIPVAYLGYQPLLRLAAATIMSNDEPGRSDVILVLAGGEPARPWEAADLYRENLADYVIVTRETQTAEVEELQKKGIDWVDGRGNYIRVLRGFGVPEENIISIDPPVEDTFAELQLVRQLCEKRKWTSIIVVTSNYHTRRARLSAHYVFGPRYRIAVVGSTHGRFNRDTWWRNRADVRTFLIEFEKLVAYTLYIWPRSLWTSPSDTSQLSISSVLPAS